MSIVCCLGASRLGIELSQYFPRFAWIENNFFIPQKRVRANLFFNLPEGQVAK